MRGLWGGIARFKHSAGKLRVERVLQEVVTLLGRKHICRSCETKSGKESDRGADSAENPRHIQVPAWNCELVIIVEKIGLLSFQPKVQLPRSWSFIRARGLAQTHHNSDGNKLKNGNNRHHKGGERPARLPLVLAALYNDDKGDQTSQTHQGRDGRQETNGPPHGTEISLTLLA
jgi:hypothetical protein